MNLQPVSLCIFLLLAAFIAGCTTPSGPVEKSVNTSPIPAKPTVITYTSANSTTVIPVLLTDNDWKMAGDCGWTVADLSETAALFMKDCEVRHLISDGWEIAGIGYDMNFIGSRCRQSTHPGTGESCDWCLDAGPTLTLRYKGLITTEMIAHTKEKTVTGFRTDLTEEMVSESTNGLERILYRNGTEIYTFRSCNGGME